ncbi:MAG: toxin regulator [Clostridia bacterium]|nr:toxin regulator [Clostridia bacterium]
MENENINITKEENTPPKMEENTPTIEKNTTTTKEKHTPPKTIADNFRDLIRNYPIVVLFIAIIAAFYIGVQFQTVMSVDINEYNKVKTGLETKEQEYTTLQNEYNAYKEKMQPYEEIQLVDAQYKAEQEKQELAQKKEAEEKAAAEEKARKEAEEAMGYETGITFDNLARTPNDYIGKKVKFKGKVVQVVEGDTETQIRLAVNGNYDKIIFCRVPKSKTVSTRILEDDYIHIMGVSNGLISYQSTMGGTITIPDVSVDDWGQS